MEVSLIQQDDGTVSQQKISSLVNPNDVKLRGDPR